MDLIYQAATITLIAAYGANAEAGLPGVGDTPRRHQPVVRIGDQLMLINTLGRPTRLIKDSPWHSRAWTLQEGLLSSR